MAQPLKSNHILLLAPTFGALLFVALYVIATFLYPGGSQADANVVGFSWANNYWCNLLNENAINGRPNPARPVAMAAMVVLGLALSIFWWFFPKQTNMGKLGTLAIQVPGTLAMLAALLLATNINHDVATNLASLLGFVATIGTLVGLYNNRWQRLFAFGLFNLLLVALNNYVYRTKGLIVYLPVVQKISFASFLLWVCCINIRLYRSACK